MFFQAVYFGQSLSFYTMQLEPPKNDSNKRTGSLNKIWKKSLVQPPKLTKMQL